MRAIARGLCAALVTLILGQIAGVAIAQAEHPEIARRRAAARKSFTDAEIFRGFFLTAFGAEMRLAGRSDRIRKYVAPVRVYVDNRATPDRTAQVAAVVADIRAHVANLDIAITDERASATTIVRLLRGRDFYPTLRAQFGSKRARRIRASLDPQCLSGFRKDATFRIVHSDVYLVADTSDFIFADCIYEELLQSMGPINDTGRVRWTMFNDAVQMGFFDVYDQYILNILYHPRVQPGMTAGEVRALLPTIMPDVRAFVAKVNGLPR